jgi:hypothetical protein
MTRIQEGKKKQIHLRVLTMIDPATSYFDITQIENVTAETTALAFDRTWLSRFPRPFRCLHDSGNEFVGKEFQQLLTSYGIKDVCAATRNPQTNAILERMHAVLTNSLRTFKLDEQVLDVNNPWEGFLAATRFAINSTYHTVNEATPGQLVFGRDMIMPTVFQVNWPKILQRRQANVAQDNAGENTTRTKHVFRVGDQVLLRNDAQRAPKLQRRAFGPFVIHDIRANGSAVIKKGQYLETVNKRRLLPYTPPA